MLPIVALIGRPNVGKSTLFNRLTASRDALVYDRPGLTRDRIYGRGYIHDRSCVVVDTGGLADAEDNFQDLMTTQAQFAMSEAAAIIFLVDGKAGLTAADETVAQIVRRSGKPVYLAVNKSDGLNAMEACADFQRLGFEQTFAVAATTGKGLESLNEAIVRALPVSEDIADSTPEGAIRFAVVGRPNVGKSTLVNRILGEQRVLVFDEPGTTRDSVTINFVREEAPYVIIDTAGVRRRGKIDDVVEKFSVAKTMQAIDAAHVVVLVLDAREGVTDQDLTLAGLVLESGRAVVLSLNKWDGLTPDQRQHARNDVDRKLDFLKFARVHYISALHGTGVGDLFGSINGAYAAATKKISTTELNKVLEILLSRHQPPIVRGRRIKLRYAHQGGNVPPLIIVHGNQTDLLPAAYVRYLSNGFRERFKLDGTPVRVELRTGENPFKGRKNPLTKRQIQKRKRLKKFLSKK